MATHPDLIPRLEALRAELNLNHGEFARSLDLPASTWSRLRNRKLGLSAGVALRIVRRRPEFLAEIGIHPHTPAAA